MSLPYHSTGAAKALTAAYAVATVASIPDMCTLGDVLLQVASIAAGATTITWYLAADLAGDIPLSPVVTSTIVTGLTTATVGSIIEALDKPYSRFAGLEGNIYIVAKTNAGTCTVTPRLTWSL